MSSWPASRSTPTSETIIQIAPGPRLGEKVLKFEGRLQGVRRRQRPANLDAGLLVQCAARRDRRRDRPQRHGQDDAHAHDRRPGAARRRHDRHWPDRRPILCRSAPRRPERREQRCSPRSPAEPIGSRWATCRSIPAPTSPVSTSAARNNRKRWANARAASETASIWPRCSVRAATCCCWTNRPTTSTWPRCGCWNRRCWISRAARWSSATTGSSSTESARTCWVMEGDGRTRWFEGNFAAYEAAVMAENPDRFAHRRAKYQQLGGKLR